MNISACGNYDEGYGTAHIATDLIIIGEDWWTEREEYDGSENWKLEIPPEAETLDKVTESLLTRRRRGSVAASEGLRCGGGYRKLTKG